MPFSISAAIGFIALSGVAVLDDMLLVSTIRRLRRQGMDLEEAVESGHDASAPGLDDHAGRRVRLSSPWPSTRVWAPKVQRPLATVVIGGVISATVMSLLVLRVLYMVFAGSVVRGDSTESDDEDRGDQPELHTRRGGELNSRQWKMTEVSVSSEAIASRRMS